MSQAPTVVAPIRAEPKLPPSQGVPNTLFSLAFMVARRPTTDWLTRRYGRCVTVRIPVFGNTVVVSDPALTKQIFTSSPDVLYNIQPNLSRLLGPGSVFALDGAEHRARRKLLTPPFHGKSIRAYEQIVVEETLREIESWPQGTEFATLEPMMHITLNIILRAIFGADGLELQRLRALIPKWVTLGSRLAVLPSPKREMPWTPWGRLVQYRREYEGLVDTLISRAQSDPNLEDRTDVLSLFLRSTYDDGSPMTRGEIGDELLTLLAAGHETTASTLAWAFERISRHPEVLSRLVAEADTEDNSYRQATILEVQRNRTVIDFSGRHVQVPSYELGEWMVPQGYSVMVSLCQLHENPEMFEDPERFDPLRFLDTRPNTFAWVPFGGGTRRCIGAAFANMEMDVVLRTVLRHFTIATTTAPGEKWHSRGVAFTPKKGGRVIVHRRA
ncbi:cytochrome P450 [Mycolicibacterium aromaticivorans JS19b1 = JCM 16368]|uniref:Cytochrome P450 n=1 Tax=Mycolicibacterium aromaticivorans JS19b1 = JCM 16368 TaxID=1440774 RepID=A0A064CK35_9MYCO|nr:cytochrome P450 [Mycolicibacterium aromaticivorans]KDF00032.1 cytochrome P450 [Mycolicibacterium aromaticivorans JS19b1 = JCM 16368]